MTKVLVTGATGALGPRVVAELCLAGYAVRTLSLAASSSELLPETVDIRLGDITNKAAVYAAMDGIDMIVHMAALLHIFNPSPDLRPKYEQVNVGGTANVVEAAIQTGVKRIVFFSTIAVYGHTSGRILSEETFPKPESFYAQTKLDAERIVLQARKGNDQPLGVVLRLGAVYGPGIKGNYRRLLQTLMQGRFIPIGSGYNRRTLVYDKDVVQAVLLALEHPQAAGRIYNVTDGEFHSLTEIIKTMCVALGQRVSRWYIPEMPVKVVAMLVDTIGQLVFRRTPGLRAMIDKYTEDVAVDGRRIQEELGFIPHYDLATGWRETVQEMRNSGSL